MSQNDSEADLQTIRDYVACTDYRWTEQDRMIAATGRILLEVVEHVNNLIHATMATQSIVEAATRRGHAPKDVDYYGNPSGGQS